MGGIFDSIKNSLSGTPASSGGFGWEDFIPMIPSIIGGATDTFGAIAGNELKDEQYQQTRQDDLFKLQMELMKDMATIPGGSSSSSWQEGGTGNLTAAQNLQAIRQGSMDKINQYNNILGGYYGARK